MPESTVKRLTYFRSPRRPLLRCCAFAESIEAIYHWNPGTPFWDHIFSGNIFGKKIAHFDMFFLPTSARSWTMWRTPRRWGEFKTWLVWRCQKLLVEKSLLPICFWGGDMIRNVEKCRYLMSILNNHKLTSFRFSRSWHSLQRPVFCWCVPFGCHCCALLWILQSKFLDQLPALLQSRCPGWSLHLWPFHWRLEKLAV